PPMIHREIMNFVAWIVFGGVAGWLAGQIMKGGGFGLIGNVIVGIIGSFVGGFLFSNVLGLGAVGFNLMGLLAAVVGAVILLLIVGIIRRA
ncbi:MAG: GlsB/YeaQ/YmgE family stress response membrane protein, partial [Chloroflexota bacterium]